MPKHYDKYTGEILDETEMAERGRQQFHGGAAIICGIVAFLATFGVCFAQDNEIGTPFEKIAVIAVPIAAMFVGYRLAGYVYAFIGLTLGGTALFFLLRWIFD